MRTTVHRGLAAVLLVLAAVSVLFPSPAQAHGAVQNPISRVIACGPDGGQRNRTPACLAAIAAGGRLTDWDNLRVANVAGRDRQVIPDGKLCSGGLDQYRGLDLPRADWPATNLTAGAPYSFSYRETIAHRGMFRMYVTKDSYDPTHPLRWADLETTPFLTATDPPIQGSAYVMKGRLPAGKTGRHLIYTIWQNTSTADTYYSCSDVVFVAARPAASTGVPAPGPVSAPPAVESAVESTGPASASSIRAGAVDVAATRESGGGTPWVLIGVVVALVAAAIAGVAIRRRTTR